KLLNPEEATKKLAPFFRPPAELANDLGKFRSPLLFNDGTPVRTAADWQKRRQEILKTWHGIMGAWPALIDKPKLTELDKEQRDGLTQLRVHLEVAPGKTAEDAYLLIPEGKGPFPAVLVVFYDAGTGIGRGQRRSPHCDFALQLARRGFGTLSLGYHYDMHVPSKQNRQLQPVSYPGYTAANCATAPATLPQVDPKRIGVVGHSYGGKWAMFGSCLYEKFACAAWSDPGIVFDEKRGNVNYWDPWYLGYEPSKDRPRGIPGEKIPRVGPYKKMIETGRDLHELHVLMAPRPFLVSGGSEDPPERWKALNHTVAVNRLLGYEDRVAMTNRKGHTPTRESNEVLCLFFEYFLGHGKAFEPAKPK